jgi:hypothetical protein
VSGQEGSQTGWRQTRQGDWKCWVEVTSGSDADGGGGKTTMGASGDGMEVVHRPTV